MDNYGHNDREMLKTKMEKYVPTPVIVDYLLRKVLLYLILGNLSVLRYASKLYGFHYEATVGDRVEWDWEVRKKVPRYHAQVERKD